MSDLEDNLKILTTQEQDLQFTSFSNHDAWEIGQLLVEKAMKENKVVTIDITRNTHQLFHYALEGTTPDNDQWIKGKMRVVNQFSHSSHYVSLLLQKKGSSIEGTYGLNTIECAAHGGSFPIIIKSTGVIGTITVSGLPSEEDHQMVVDVLSEYLRV